MTEACRRCRIPVSSTAMPPEPEWRNVGHPGCLWVTLFTRWRKGRTMILKQFYLNCLAHASYLIGDEQTHTAAVVDPQRDVDQYLAFAAEHGLRIRRIHPSGRRDAAASRSLDRWRPRAHAETLRKASTCGDQEPARPSNRLQEGRRLRPDEARGGRGRGL